MSYIDLVIRRSEGITLLPLPDVTEGILSAIFVVNLKDT